MSPHVIQQHIFVRFALPAAILLLGTTQLRAAPPATLSASRPAEAAERPVSEENAKVYLEIGQTFLLRIAEIRRVTGELKLPADQQAKCDQVYESVRQQIETVMADLAGPNRPGGSRVFAVEQRMRKLGDEVAQIIGAERTKELRTMMDSTRAIARMWVIELSDALPRKVTLTAEQKARTDAILADALRQCDQLPRTELAGDEQQAAIKEQNKLFRSTREALFGVLTPEQQETLKKMYRAVERG